MRNQLWVFICVGLICGVMIEIMKAPAASPVRLAGFKKFEAFLDEGSPVLVADNETVVENKKSFFAPRAKAAPAAPAPLPVAPVAMPVTTAPAKPLVAPTAPVDPKKKAEDDKKKVEEKKKKEEEEKKAKEEKEKKDTEELEAQQQQEQQQQVEQQQAAEAKKAADTKAAEALDTPGQGPQAQPHAANAAAINYPAPTSTSQTAAQWETYVMQNPTAAKTTQFVQYYKSGKISATTFYTVTAAALASSQVTVREQGISALGQTPSAKSFTALSDQASKESDPTAKAQAEADLQQYSSVANVVYLKTVITGSDQAAAIQAIDILKLSADTNLVSTVGSTSTQTTGSAPMSAAQLSTSYTPFIAELTQLEQSTNPSIRSLATETLTDLQSLLAPFQVTQN